MDSHPRPSVKALGKFVEPPDMIVPTMQQSLNWLINNIDITIKRPLAPWPRGRDPPYIYHRAARKHREPGNRPKGPFFRPKNEQC